jgi:hypothetical protein
MKTLLIEIVSPGMGFKNNMQVNLFSDKSGGI